MKAYVSVVSYDNSNCPEEQNVSVLAVSASRKKVIEAAKLHYDQIMYDIEWRGDELVPEQTTKFSVETPDKDEYLAIIWTTDGKRYMYVVMEKDMG